MATNREVFDRIARSWYGFRHWPLLRRDLEELAARWAKGRIVNLGCGHGADFLPFAHGFQLTGLDFSRGMLRQARAYMRKHGFSADLVQGDLGMLPFGDGSFDYAVAVASYHHIEGEGAREQSFRELHRILKPDGEAFLSVWRNPAGQTAEPEDRLVPWQSGDEVLQRYYHFFTPGELRATVERCGFEVRRLGPGMRAGMAGGTDERNLCLLARKR